jgi:predicted ribosome quality control (RQC) complex YloA/Tae2 family protein
MRALTLAELRRAARVLERWLAGRRLQAVSQPDATSVVLTAYGGEGDERGRLLVHLCARPESARVGELASPPPSLPRPPAFAQLLRARAVGARLRGCRLVDDDRQLALRLETREGPMELLLAVLGRRSNVVLLDGAGRLVAALRPLAQTRPELSLGEPWRSPESRPPHAGEDRFADVDDGALLSAIEEHFAAGESEDTAQALRRRLETALGKEARGLDRKLEKVSRELSDAESATGCERQGQLLKSVLSGVRKGDREARARDFETGEEVVIPLDPARTPAENLEALFKRYRKAVRTLTRAGAQQEAVREDRRVVAALESELRGLLEAEDAEALEAFAERPDVAALLKRHAPLERPRPPRPGTPRETKLAGRVVPGRLVPRRYRSESGLEIWVGRSDAGNDFLTTRLARGNDLFFHLDGAPGSHVILRTGGRSDPPPEAVLDACELAVHFSKAKNATRADVHVVPIKNVSKPRGAKPGLVTVHGGKTVHLRRIPARLQRLLASRIDGVDGDGP